MLSSRSFLAGVASAVTLILVGCGDASPESGAGSTSGTTAGVGGGGGDPSTGGGGAGGTEPFTPAPHGAPPQVVKVNPNGKVLKTPRVMAITYASDPHAADIDAFMNELTTTPYWATATAEYGVGALTVADPVHRPEQAPATITDAVLSEDLIAKLSGANPAWGPADANTIYLFVLPEGTIIDAFGKCCESFDGYHDEAKVGSVRVPYAVTCTCPGFDGPAISDLQQVTVVVSHELVEAATDPRPQSSTAWAQTDDDHAIWTVETGGENADLCAFNADSFVVPPGATYMIQRSWSNASALAGKNPCVPVGTAPYFNSAPVLTDPVTLDYYGTWDTKGVTIPVGQTKVIDVQLFSEAKTSGPWSVKAIDVNSEFFGGKPLLDLSLDKAEGLNGDVLHLTIKVLSADQQLNGEAFAIESNLGGQQSYWFGVVGN